MEFSYVYVIIEMLLQVIQETVTHSLKILPIIIYFKLILWSPLIQYVIIIIKYENQLRKVHFPNLSVVQSLCSVLWRPFFGQGLFIPKKL